nr:hypothetical protein [Micromonospora sp. ATA51]
MARSSNARVVHRPENRVAATSCPGISRVVIRGSSGSGSVAAVKGAGMANRTSQQPGRSPSSWTIGAVTSIFSVLAGSCTTGAVMPIGRRDRLAPPMYRASSRNASLPAVAKSPSTRTSATRCGG